jgi:inner membrane protein
MTRRRRIENRLLNPSPALVVLAFLAFALDQFLFQWLGPKSTVFLGAFDETDHLLTTLLIVWALFLPWIHRRQLLPVFLASCLIDLDHIPGQLGSTILTGGDPRPYTHSLATVVVLLLIALLWRRNRLIFLALALGVTSHLWRDLAEPSAYSGVSLYWPLSHEGIHFNSNVYLGSIVIFAGIALGRSLMRSHRAVTAVPGGI